MDLWPDPAELFLCNESVELLATGGATEMQETGLDPGGSSDVDQTSHTLISLSAWETYLDA